MSAWCRIINDIHYLEAYSQPSSITDITQNLQTYLPILNTDYRLLNSFTGIKVPLNLIMHQFYTKIFMFPLVRGRNKFSLQIRLTDCFLFLSIVIYVSPDWGEFRKSCLMMSFLLAIFNL